MAEDPEVRGLRERVVALEAERDEAREALMRFAYTVSHDLKEPLRAVTGFGRLLTDRCADQLEGEASTYLRFMVDGAERMARMLDALLALSRLARHEVAVEVVDPVALLEEVREEVLERLGPAAARASAVVGDLPAVRADRHLLGVVLRELLANAVTFTDDGPAAVEVEAVPVDVVDQPGDAVRLVVRDHGIGIAPEHLDRVTEVFTRLHPRERFPGLGAGLALADLAALRLGTRLELGPADGGGTAAAVVLPTA